MISKPYVFLFCVHLSIYANSVEFDARATVNQGTVIGKTMTSRAGKPFNAFLSIPYAEPPVGDLRFTAPVPARPWNGELNGTVSHPVCPQIDVLFQTKKVEGDENCLFLNVYTPKVFPSQNYLYSVMIFIHGGGFASGTGQMYNPDYLIDEEVVLVTFNYRLGVLGFLTTGDDVVPGNNGLKDQALAIKWVYENIKPFGGDPEKITIFGESAGGASVHLHTFSPLSQGYLKRAISQSGTAFNNWALTNRETAVYRSEQIGVYFGCLTNDHKKMIQCLRLINIDYLLKSQESFVQWDIEPLVLFGPVVELYTKGAFLPEHPSKVLKSGKYANISWMTGINSEEGCLRVASIYKNQKLIDDLDTDFDRIMSLTLNIKYPNFKEVVQNIREFYFGNKKIDNTTMYYATNLYSDLLFIPAADAAVKLHLKYSKQPVYYYFLSHKSRNSFGELFGVSNIRYGTCHTDGLLLQFPLTVLFGNPQLDDIDTYYSKLMNKLLTNFAKTGNPTPERDSVTSTAWKPVTSGNLEYYHIGGGVHTSSNLYPERIQFWEKLNTVEKLNIQDEL